MNVGQQQRIRADQSKIYFSYFMMLVMSLRESQSRKFHLLLLAQLQGLLKHKRVQI